MWSPISWDRTPLLLQLGQRELRAHARRRDEEEARARADAARALLVPLGCGVHLGHRRVSPALRLLHEKLRSRTRTPASALCRLIWCSSSRSVHLRRDHEGPLKDPQPAFVRLRAGVRRALHLSMVRRLEYRGYAIHLGATFGTIMAYNVWFRIWPSQKEIIRRPRAVRRRSPSSWRSPGCARSTTPTCPCR